MSLCTGRYGLDGPTKQTDCISISTLWSQQINLYGSMFIDVYSCKLTIVDAMESWDLNFVLILLCHLRPVGTCVSTEFERVF